MFNDTSLSQFGLRSRHALSALLASPLVDKVLADAEERLLKSRTAIAAQLQALPASHEKERAAAGRRERLAEKKVRDAESALAEARSAYVAAANASLAAGFVEEREAYRLTRELEDTADPRLLKFADVLNGIVFELKGRSQRVASMQSDRVEFALPDGLNEALLAAELAIRQVRDLRLQVLSHAQVTDTLRAISDRLQPAFAVLDVGAPRVLLEHVLEPLRNGVTVGHSPTESESRSLGISH